jgi:transcriptional regulator with XRE-family HTH domain
MDDLAIGRLFRELRLRLGWPQRVVAAKARISQTAYSAIERGLFEGVPVGKLRRVAAVLEVRLQLEPRWRGAGVDRVLSSRHAQLSDVVIRLLVAAGWEARPEVSFSHFGERGIVDIVAWHAATGAILLVEIKTELVDANALLGVVDRRRRLAAEIAAPFGWTPAHVGSWVVVAESRTNRRRLAEVQALVRAALPANGHAVARWLARPLGGIAALSFVTDSRRTGSSQRCAPRLRVRPSVGKLAGRAS